MYNLHRYRTQFVIGLVNKECGNQMETEDKCCRVTQFKHTHIKYFPVELEKYFTRNPGLRIRHISMINHKCLSRGFAISSPLHVYCLKCWVCSNTGSIRDYTYWTSRENSLELIPIQTHTHKIFPC